MTTLADKLVEAGARAFAFADEGTDADWKFYSPEMRAALHAVLPMLEDDIIAVIASGVDPSESTAAGVNSGLRGAHGAVRSLLADLLADLAREG